MVEVRSEHWACGMGVVERVPDDHDVAQGLAMLCPRCRDAWWHYPEPGAVDAIAPPPRAAVAEQPSPAATWPADAGPTGRSRDWLGPVLIVAAVAVIVLRLADFGRGGDRPERSAAGTAAQPASDADAGVARAAPAPAPRVRMVDLQGPGFTLRRPAVWTVHSEGAAMVVAPPGGGPVSLRIHVDTRPDLSLAQMGEMSRRTLSHELPGATITGPFPIRLRGQPAVRVTGARGGDTRLWTVLAAGSQRYVLEVRAAPAAGPAERALASATLRSFRTTE